MRAASWIQTWDSQGVHRTGTPGDNAGGGLAGRRSRVALGGDVTNRNVRTQPDGSIRSRAGSNAPATGSRACRSSTSPPTGPGGIRDAIALVHLSPWAVYTPDYHAMRHASDRAGMVIVCEGAEPGLGLLNAERFREPHGCPAIHVARMPWRDAGADGELLSPDDSGRPQRRGHNSRPRQVPARDCRNDATLVLVAIDVRTRRRSGVLA